MFADTLMKICRNEGLGPRKRGKGWDMGLVCNEHNPGVYTALSSQAPGREPTELQGLSVLTEVHN
jgi:hypothetical protein